MTMVENNKLIAEFLGWKEQTDPTEKWLGHWFTDKGVRQSDLSFDIDWRDLMEVVKKIETLETEDKRTFTIDMHMDSVLIFEYALTTNEIVFTEGQGRFKNLYNACVEFVKWYNENKI